MSESNSDERGIGKAYGFFDCRASKEEIETELPAIRESTKVPAELRLSLYEGMDGFMNDIKDDPELVDLTKRAETAGMRYVLDATLPCAGNETTADEVAAVLIQVYQTPFFRNREEFRGEIAYKQDGKYLFRE
jgi:hypothetical protein